MEKKASNKLIKFYIPIILYVIFAVGVILYNLPSTQSLAKTLTPAMLLGTSVVCCVIAFKSTSKSSSIKHTGLWISIVSVVTFIAEVLGTNYGLIFGNYLYSDILGVKLFSVPVIISLNWVMITWGIFALINKLVKSTWFFIFISAIVAVVFDWFMEPVAIALDFWRWSGDEIPLSNYISWFGLTIFAAILWKILDRKYKLSLDSILGHLVLAQFGFFLVLNLFSLV